MTTSFANHVDTLRAYLLRYLLSVRLGIRYPISLHLTSVPNLDQHVIVLLNSHRIHTVGEAIEAYCLHHETPQVGEGRWAHFFNCVAKQ